MIPAILKGKRSGVSGSAGRFRRQRRYFILDLQYIPLLPGQETQERIGRISCRFGNTYPANRFPAASDKKELGKQGTLPCKHYAIAPVVELVYSENRVASPFTQGFLLEIVRRFERWLGILEA
jgi:hypothetical protein